jgi:hypothetical protein
MIGKDAFVNEYAKWLKQNGHDGDLSKKHNPHILLLILGIGCLCYKYTAIIGIVIIVQYVLAKKKAKVKINNEWKKIYAKRSILCEPIMINSDFINGDSRVAPGLFIGSFDASWGTNRELRYEIMANIDRARNGELGPDLQRKTKSILENEKYVANRRRRVPPELTKGITVYFLDVALVQEWMWPQAKEQDCWEIICAADYGPTGEVDLIPNEAIDTKVERILKKQLGKGYEKINN